MSEDRFGLVGKFIADRYEVEALVEEGGFSTIYRARHVIWDRPVAIKAFRAPQSLSEAQREELQQGFIREGALLAELSERSVAICQSRDVGTLTLPSGAWVPYLVLEWLDGESLEAMLTRERAARAGGMHAKAASEPRTLAETMKLLEPIALALGVAHDRGIAHRDVKPGNLFLLRDGGIKLLDFGIAKAGARRDRKQTGPEFRSFTPDYGAPEQFSMAFGPTGTWTDVFAFALIVVELLTGREALSGTTPEELARSAMDPDVRPTPRARGVSAAVVPEAVDAVLAEALAIDPRERFATAGEMWRALRAAVDDARAADIASRRSDAVLASTVPPPAPLDETAHAAGGPRRSGWRSPALAFGAGALTATVALVAAMHTRGSIGRLAPLAPLASAASAPAAPPVDVARPEPVVPAAAPEPPTCPAGMAQIPGGAFFMGSDQGVDAERPAHSVTLAPYCIDLTEVTTADYKACSDRGECKRAWSSNEWDGIKEHERKVFDPLCNARDPAGRAQHPINCVDWSMAQAFCATRGARLPTEAEWELAARGPDGRAYPWGDDPPTARHLNACGKECAAWGKKNRVDEVAMFAEDDGFATTAPVGSFPLGRSPFGLADMVGNVWEWVFDRYAPYPATRTPATPPDAIVDPTGPADGGDRVLRGGAWNGGYAPSVRATFRSKSRPETKGYGVGFRCARTL